LRRSIKSNPVAVRRTNKTSIANLIPNVWMALQHGISSP